MSDGQLWTGRMILAALKTHMTPAAFVAIPDDHITVFKSSKFFYEDDLRKVLLQLARCVQPLNILYDDHEKFCNDILSQRRNIGSAELFQLDACLDFFRRPSCFGDIVMTKQELLHLHTITFAKDDFFEHFAPLVRIVTAYEVDKITRRIKTFELVDKKSLKDGHHVMGEFIESRMVMIQNRALKELNPLSRMNGAQYKKWISTKVFGGEKHYLIPLFNQNIEELLQFFANHDKTISYHHIYSQVIFVKEMLSHLMGTTLTYLTASSQDLDRQHLKKPIMRIVMPFPGFEFEFDFVFTTELINAINVLHRMKKDGRSFNKELHSLTYDENDLHFNTIRVISIVDICRKEGLKDADIRFVTIPLSINERSFHEPYLSPMYTLCVPAGSAFMEFRTRLLLYTDNLSSLNAANLHNLEEYLDTLYCTFDPIKTNFYNINYQVFQRLLENLNEKSKSFIIPKSSSSERTQITKGEEHQIEWFPEIFRNTEKCIRQALQSVSSQKKKEVSSTFNRLVALAFMAKFPKFSMLCHNQLFCGHHHGMCLLEFVTDGSAKGMERCQRDGQKESVSDLLNDIQSSILVLTKSSNSTEPVKPEEKQVEKTLFSGLKRGFFNKSVNSPEKKDNSTPAVATDNKNKITATAPKSEKSTKENAIKNSSSASNDKIKNQKIDSERQKTPVETTEKEKPIIAKKASKKNLNKTEEPCSSTKHREELIKIEPSMVYNDDNDDLRRALEKKPPLDVVSASAENGLSIAEKADEVQTLILEQPSKTEKNNFVVEKTIEERIEADKSSEQKLSSRQSETEFEIVSISERISINIKSMGFESTSDEMEHLDVNSFCEKLKKHERLLLDRFPDEKIGMADFQDIVRDVLKDSWTSEYEMCLNGIVSGNVDDFLAFQSQFVGIFDVAIRGKENKRYIRKKRTGVVGKDILMSPLFNSATTKTPSRETVREGNSTYEPSESDKSRTESAMYADKHIPKKSNRPEWQNAYMYGRTAVPRDVNSEDEVDDLANEPAIPLYERVVPRSNKPKESQFRSNIRVADTSRRKNQYETEEQSSSSQQRNERQPRTTYGNVSVEYDFDPETDEELNEDHCETESSSRACGNCTLLVDKAINDENKLSSLEKEVSKLEVEKFKTEMKFLNLERKIEKMCSIDNVKVDELNTKIVELSNANNRKDAVILNLEQRLQQFQHEMESLKKENEKLVIGAKFEKETATAESRRITEEVNVYRAMYDVLNSKFVTLEILNTRLLCNENDNEILLKSSQERIKQLEEQLEKLQGNCNNLLPSTSEAVENQLENINIEKELHLEEMNNTHSTNTPSSSTETTSGSMYSFILKDVVDEVVPVSLKEQEQQSTSSSPQLIDLSQLFISNQKLEKAVNEKLNELKEYSKLLGEKKEIGIANQILESFIASSNDSKNIKLAESRFAEYLEEFNKFTETVLENIDCLEKSPDWNTLNSLKPLPKLPTPFKIELMTQIEKQCKSSTSAWNIKPQNNAAGFEVDDPECLICINNIESHEEVTKCETCRRRYHSKCVSQWVVHNSICPICRSGLPDPSEFPTLK